MKVTLQDGSAVFLPGAGHVGYFAAETPPEGYLVCNGAEVSRSAYPELFAAIGTTYGAGNGSTTFNLPDLKGKFIRGTGGDAAALGVAQGDAIRNIKGHFSIRNVLNGDMANAVLPFSVNSAPSNGGITVSGDRYVQQIQFDASRVVPTAAENRPVNLAFLSCIKY